ncbi:protein MICRORCHIDIA 7-like isoform X3 [Diospyros lotus]|uniref:protein MICRORCHIDIA 7-like isoform X3 n=1 Tax=Diospyros lotus TaxID=55363 RepID=UPI002253F10E|nr:protein MICRORCHIDIA 7-like isoform X3 [Diospyros lotus]
MDGVQVKKEVVAAENTRQLGPPPSSISVIDLTSSDSDSDDSLLTSSSGDDDNGDGAVPGTNGKRPGGVQGGSSKKKRKKKLEDLSAALPVGFLDPLPPKSGPLALTLPIASAPSPSVPTSDRRRIATTEGESCKHFWKAGDYAAGTVADWDITSGGMDHVRVHPKFLHSNATVHKWVLGAFAELLDNALDEVCSGATLVNIDMLINKKDDSRMLLIEDDGGGMDPDKIRHCMSLGYSVKSKMADTIGKYGNGFKTSTMRLGADVIVFSRCCGKNGKRPTQCIGLLSYTFLRSTGKEDIVVPMLDYERGTREWNRMLRSSDADWDRNVKTIVQWSPFLSEADLLHQFDQMKAHGTRIFIYNLWEDDQGQLELDFDDDPYDIQVRGDKRDENVQMAKEFPNSKHFLTYKLSLRSYASILYLRIPTGFRIILRGKDVEHHNVVNDMMMTQSITYRPQPGSAGTQKDSNMVAVVTLGFVKDAKAHINVHGFNVYHKNRLIQPFWKVWNPSGSDGRGVIGVLEANFVEPAHDKQGFERTTVLSRLEARLVQMQKLYWSTNCHKIGYAPRRNKKLIDDIDTSPDYGQPTASKSKKKNTGSSSKMPILVSDKLQFYSNQNQGRRESERYLETVEKRHQIGRVHGKGRNVTKTPTRSAKEASTSDPSSPTEEFAGDNEMQAALPEREANGNSEKQGDDANGNELRSNSSAHDLVQLKEENRQLKEKLNRKEEEILGDLLGDLQQEREKSKLLENKLKEATQKIEELNKEQEGLIEIFSEERERRDIEEENLRKKLKDASNTIQELLDEVKRLEKMKSRLPK